VKGGARSPRSRGALIIAAGLIGLAGAGALVATGRGGDAGTDSPARIALGRAVYDLHCASCHGADLQGAPDWRTPLPSGRLPAPPHDATGHTWHHPDSVLFRIVRDGTAAVVGGGYESDMTGFGGILSDTEIAAVLAYIRSTWPERERRFQRDLTRVDEAARAERAATP
jgi:mono/diheme cytochrome c family protein